MKAGCDSGVMAERALQTVLFSESDFTRSIDSISPQ